MGDVDSPHIHRWVAALDQAGYTVVLAGFGESADVDGAEFMSLGSQRLSWRRYVVAVPALRAILRRVRPLIVNAHFVSSYGVMAALARPMVPLVLSAWGSDVLWLPQRARLHQRTVRWAVRRAALVTYDAEEVRKGVTTAAPNVPMVRIVFGPEESWLDDPPASGERILSPRGLDSFYGIATILEAFAIARERGLTWSLDVLTYGMRHDDLVAVANEAGITDHVRFHGRLAREEVRNLFGACEVFCSVPSSDGTAASLLEGMAAGSFPIASAVPANREWIDHEVNGLIVPAGDAPRLARAFERGCSDRGLRTAAAEENRARIRQHATWEHAVDDLHREFGRLVE